MTPPRHLITILLVLLWLASVAADHDAQPPFRRAFLETFDLRLAPPDTTSQPSADASPPAVAARSCPLTPCLPRHLGLPSPTLQRLLTLGQAGLLALSLLPLVLLIRHARSPQQRASRQARRTLRRFLHHQANLNEAFHALRTLCQLPPGASDAHLADTLAQQRHRDLADACRDLAQRRFAVSPPADAPDSASHASAAPASSQADTHFRDALARFLRRAALSPQTAVLLSLSVMLLCAAVALHHHQRLLNTRDQHLTQRWRDADRHARAGNLSEALDLLLDLHRHGIDTPEQSDNLALLLSLAPQSSAGASPHSLSPQAWQLHARLQRDASPYRVRPLILEPHTILYASPDGETPIATLGDQPQTARLLERLPSPNARLLIRTASHHAWVSPAQTLD
ncbi:MAG: hypothetical protein ACI4WT_13265 [Oligosphaeraceae bacterium]